MIFKKKIEEDNINKFKFKKQNFDPNYGYKSNLQSIYFTSDYYIENKILKGIAI